MRILIVEDDKNIASFLKINLKEACFVVDIENDGESGLFAAMTNDYDLIILDNMLPKKTGKEVCKKIREKKSVPIIMLSVKSGIREKVDLLSVGADDYLGKPFSFEELLARIKAILRRPKKVVKKILKYGDIKLDSVKNEVLFKDKEIYLRRKEFMLLQLFINNVGQVLTRATILEHVWDSDVDPFSNTIESHISSLRKKFGNEKDNSFIETVSGRGYMLKSK